MKTIVFCASGATGKQLVAQLMSMGQQVKVIVRPTSTFPESWNHKVQITIINANISDIGVDEMTKYLTDCEAMDSCLGHNISMKGIFGKPKRLVTDAVKLTCAAIEKNALEKPIKFVLMNTTANRNREAKEIVSMSEKLVMRLIRSLVPPQADNEQAAGFLSMQIGQHNQLIEWVAVRPDTLIDEDEVSEYTLHNSPTRSALFNAGKTSRINVGNFMARLVVDNELWNQWKGQMPVIYNQTL